MITVTTQPGMLRDTTGRGRLAGPVGGAVAERRRCTGGGGGVGPAGWRSWPPDVGAVEPDIISDAEHALKARDFCVERKFPRVSHACR